MLHVNINKSHVNIIMLHVDIIYLACRGRSMPPYNLYRVSWLFLCSWLYWRYERSLKERSIVLMKIIACFMRDALISKCRLHKRGSFCSALIHPPIHPPLGENHNRYCSFYAKWYNYLKGNIRYTGIHKNKYFLAFNLQTARKVFAKININGMRHVQKGRF